jgi:hypothetical protein
MRREYFKVIFFSIPFLVVACSNNDSPVETATLTVATTTVGDNYYQGLTMQIGLAGSTDVVSESIVDETGKAVFNADAVQLAGKELWFCVPKMVKFFHTMTAGEASAKAIVLPDKDAGSTRDASGLKNDWIVALYMGVNKGGTADGVPLYWATGNLMAVKTNAAGEPSEVVCHIADAQETIEEGTAGHDLVGLDDRLISNVPDGYVNMPAGSKWDQFAFGDPTGLMLYDSEKTALLCVDGKQMKEDKTDIAFDICGDARFDAARAHLGGLWRLPTCGKSGLNEFAAFEDDCEEYSGILPDGKPYGKMSVSFGLDYTYTVTIGGKDVTINTLRLPAGGYRHANNDYGGVAKFCLYWSGTADPTGTPPYTPDNSITQTMPPFFIAFNYGYLSGVKSWYPHPRSSSQCIRPVTE